MSVNLGTLSAAFDTQDKSQAIIQLLNYCATHQYATVGFHRSNMCINIQSDASYLSKPKPTSVQQDNFT